MNVWPRLLEPFGALWNANGLVGFGDPAATLAERAQLVPMLDHRLLTFSGPDADRFLQGQLTCDLKRVRSGEHLLGAHCNAQGRMISSLQVFALDDHSVGLRVRADLLDLALAALQKYAVFAKAKLQVSDWLGLALLPGSDGARPLLAEAPELAPGGVVTLTSGAALCHASGWLELWAAPAACEALLANHAGPLKPVDSLNDWFIGAGIAEVQAQTSGEFIPQMFNYDLLDGISFKKGCYTGQEIIARLHYKGQTKKRTYLAGCEGARVGDAVVAASAPEKALGSVVAASRQRVLVCLAKELFGQQERLHLGHSSTAILRWDEQPYAIP